MSNQIDAGWAQKGSAVDWLQPLWDVTAGGTISLCLFLGFTYSPQTPNPVWDRRERLLAMGNGAVQEAKLKQGVRTSKAEGWEAMKSEAAGTAAESIWS